MNTKMIALAVAGALAVCAADAAVAADASTSKKVTKDLPPVVQRAPAVSQADVDALKAQLSALQSRLAEIEAAQKAATDQAAAAAKKADAAVAENAEQQESIDRTTDKLSQTRAGIGEWVGRWQWKGDLRMRNENIEQEYTLADRNRTRLRARFGFVAKVNDTVTSEVQLTTSENADARSPNQTLTDSNSRKPIVLDTAFMQWSPNADWKVTAGKMRYPWTRTSTTYFYDGDVNPEGLAVNYAHGATGFFAGAWYTFLAERNGPAFADSGMAGAQVGWKGTYGDTGRYTLAAGYFDFGGVKGYDVRQAGGAGGFFGNTTTAVNTVCRAGQATCLLNDYNVLDLLGETSFNLAGRPLTVWVEYAQNQAADLGVVSTNPLNAVPAGLDTAQAFGFTYGRAGNPKTWEFGYTYQKIEKDSLFGQYLDSDFGAGNTDMDGHAFRFAYAFARNWRLNMTYFINKTGNDVPVAVTVPVSRTVFDRDYKRLQVDFNVTF